MPTAVKLLRGNPGKRPLGIDAQPMPARVLPDPPALLSERGRAHWHEMAPLLYDVGVLTNVDAVGFLLLCEDFADYVDATMALRGMDTPYIESDNNSGSHVIRPHPALKQKSEAAARLHRWLVEFGCTPAARTRIKVDPAINADAAESYFTKRDS